MLASLGSALFASALDLLPQPAMETATPPTVHHRLDSDADGLPRAPTFGQEITALPGPSAQRVNGANTSVPIQPMELPGLTIQQQALAFSAASVAPPRAESLSGGRPSSNAILTKRTDRPITSSPETPRPIEMTASAALMVHTADLRAMPNIRLLASSRGGTPLIAFSPLYISYFGSAAGSSAVSSIKGQPDSTAVVSGTMTDPVTGVSDLVVAKISNDGASLLGMALIGSPDGSVALNGTGADQDNTGDGAIYFNGTATSTDNSGGAIVFGRIEPDFSGLGWGGQMFTLNGVIAGNGAKVNNGNLYLSGNATDPTTGLSDVFAVRLSNLQDDPTQVIVAGAAFGFTDSNGNSIATTGLNVTGDANGNAFTAGSYSTSDLSDTEAFSVAPSNDFTTADAIGLPFLPGSLNHGVFNSVDVDSAGFVYACGSINVHSDTGFDHFDMVLAKFDFFGHGYIRLYSLGGDFFGTGNHSDIGGTQVAQGYIVDPSDPYHLASEVLWRVNANGDPLDDRLWGVPGGSADDRSTGMDIAPDIFTGGEDYYLAGYTHSTDFVTTPGAYQDHYPGDPNHPTYQGWVADGIVA